MNLITLINLINPHIINDPLQPNVCHCFAFSFVNRMTCMTFITLINRITCLSCALCPKVQIANIHLPSIEFDNQNNSIAQTDLKVHDANNNLIDRRDSDSDDLTDRCPTIAQMPLIILITLITRQRSRAGHGRPTPPDPSEH